MFEGVKKASGGCLGGGDKNSAFREEVIEG